MRTQLVRGFSIRGLLSLSILGLIILTVSATRLSAQVIKGSISGTVVDPSGAVVPDAEIQATSPATGTVFSTKTESSGLFRLSLLAVGNYDVTITAQGFRKTAITAVEVDAGADHNLGSIQLEVGQTTTTVEVTAAPAILETSSSQVSTAIKGEILQSLPGVLANQGLDNLALLVPGVNNARDNGMSNTNGVGFAANGIRGRNNDQQIDGQNNNDNSVAGPYLFFTNPDFVQEYQIVTDNFGPEYGRNSGSVVNVVTKSGTNAWHGTVFGVESNSALDTLSNTQKAFEDLHKVPRYNDEFTGGSIGGPLKTDKVFLFGGFDNEIRSEKQVYSTGSATPTPTGIAQLAACSFANPATLNFLQKYGPYGVGGGSPTPSGTPETITITDPNSPPDSPVNCDVQVSGVKRTVPSGFHQFDGILRLDVNPTNSDRIYGRYLYQKLPFFNANSFGTDYAPAGYPNSVPGWSEDIGLSWTHTLSARMVNEARFSYGRIVAQFGGNSIGNTVPPMTALGTALSYISLPAGFLSIGPATNAPQGRVVNTYQMQDNWHYVRGRHQFKAGFNWTYQRSPNNFLPNYNGRFNYTSFDNFVANIPSSVQITAGDPSLDFREHQMFMYIGDDWKVKPNLSLNLGLTYSYFGQPANLFHKYDTKRESSDSTAFFNPTLPLSVRTFPELPSVKTNWGPSVGFAYTPGWGGGLTGGGKTVIRGGYRLAYDPPFYNIWLNVASSAPQVLAQTLVGADATGNPMPADPFGPAVRAQLAPYLVFGVADPRRFTQTTVTPDFSPDRVHSWLFGIQREIKPNLVFEARYVGNHGEHLFQSINLNPRISALAADFPDSLPSGVTPCTDSTAPGYRRVNCDLGVVRQRTNTGVSDYNGLQTQIRARNLWNQLSLLGNYTWSKTTDNVSEIFGTFGAGTTSAFSQDPLNYIHAEHGLSGLDVTHNFSVGFAEEIPAFRSQSGVLGKVLGGWMVSGSYTFASGQPYSPIQFCLNYCTEGIQYNDVSFNNSFVGTYDTSRPFVSSPSAPASAVGIFAGDLCNYDGTVGCDFPADSLVSFNTYNSSSFKSTTAVQSNQVRYIVNGAEADRQFGTPWGNAGRNTLRDYWTNSADFALFKTVKFSERTRLQWWVQFANVFNHPNFGTIDPFLDDAGLTSEFTGFALPNVQDGGNRVIRFGLKIFF
ncbi:MAG: TonB-dependent receptor [Acidobacteriia bacterium]|nr:TonB-dependent receptor [Terriglobia bacterium]